MKKSQLKQIIKEEIQKEIKLSTNNPSTSQLDRMLVATEYDIPLIAQFAPYISLNDWMEDGIEYDPDDDSQEAQELLELATIYFNWLDTKLIYATLAKDSESLNVQVFPRPFKRLITFGNGYYARIILVAF